MDVDNIRFTAINSGLGLKSPKSKSSAPTEDVIQKVSFTTFRREIIQPKESGIKESSLIESMIKHISSQILDSVSIFLFFALLCLGASWQLGIKDFKMWQAFIARDVPFLLHGLLFVATYSFYFSFFTYFKIPTPGKMLIERE